MRKFTGTDLTTGSEWNGPILLLLPADFFLFISIQYICTD